MLIFEWKYNANHRQCVLIVKEGCTDYEAAQIFKHPAVDGSMTRFFNPHTGRLECWLCKQYDDITVLWHVMEWLREDVLSRTETIKYNWSWYLDSLGV